MTLVIGSIVSGGERTCVLMARSKRAARHPPLRSKPYHPRYLVVTNAATGTGGGQTAAELRSKRHAFYALWPTAFSLAAGS